MILTHQKMFFERPKNMLRLGPPGKFGAWGAALLSIVVAGCRDRGLETPAPAAADRRPRVLATTTVVADLVRQVGGDRVVVECLMAPGIDPHSYKPTPRDADRLAGADLVVASGLHLEGKLADAARAARAVAAGGRRGRRVAGRPALAVGGGMHDPHVVVRCRACGASARLPPRRRWPASIRRPPRSIATRARDYAARLVALDERHAGASRRDSRCPPRAGHRPRRLPLLRPRLRHRGRRRAGHEHRERGRARRHQSARRTRRLARASPRCSWRRACPTATWPHSAREPRARGHAVGLGGRLYSDSLGGPGSGAETLEDVLTANVETIVAGSPGSP